MRQRLLIAGLLCGVLCAGVLNVSAFGEDILGLSASSNFQEWLVVGLQEERPNATSLIGVGGYMLSDLFWSLSARPWVQTFIGTDTLRYAGGFDLLWSHPKFLPDRAYVGFGFTVSDILPTPITNFMIGYRFTLGEGCSAHVEARLLFLNSIDAGFGCSIAF